MSKIRLTYNLNEEGQKKSLDQGGTGEEVQTLHVELTPELLALAEIGEDGVLKVDINKGLFNSELCKDFEIVPMPANQPDLAIKKWNLLLSPRRLVFSTPQSAESLIVWRKVHLDSQTERLCELKMIQKLRNKTFDIQYNKAKKTAAEAWIVEDERQKQRLNRILPTEKEA